MILLCHYLTPQDSRHYLSLQDSRHYPSLQDSRHYLSLQDFRRYQLLLQLNIEEIDSNHPYVEAL
jgi:hypothetical protein